MNKNVCLRELFPHRFIIAKLFWKCVGRNIKYHGMHVEVREPYLLVLFFLLCGFWVSNSDQYSWLGGKYLYPLSYLTDHNNFITDYTFEHLVRKWNWLMLYSLNSKFHMLKVKNCNHKNKNNKNRQSLVSMKKTGKKEKNWINWICFPTLV